MSLRFATDVILDETAITSDTASPSVELLHIIGYSMQVEYTSTTASASIEVQVSNDNETFVNLGVNQTINNDSGDVMFNVEDAYYKYVRVLVDYTSGTVDSVKVTYNGKGA